MQKIYEYKKCSTCRKALQFLEKKKISIEKIDITDSPPTKKELKKMLEHYEGNLKRLFNTSGEVYRSLKVSDQLKNGKLTERHALDLLSKNGKLIKRPFFLTDRFGLVGFKEDEWKKALKKI